ncbi:uncharacterized protein LOC144988835 [Oryzias latipes]
MDRQQYLFEANRQLQNSKYYKLIADSLQPQTQVTLRNIIQTLYTKKYITVKQRDFLFGPDIPRPRYFYLLPKIHKEPPTWTVPFEVPPGRPIISDCNSATYHISQYIDHFLGPLSVQHPSYIKDTYHFLDILRPMVVPKSSFLFTIDVNSLYTNIDTHLGLRTVNNTFIKYPNPKRPDKELLQLIELCLNNNDFLFNNQYYLQITGTAMGQRFAPSYANLYMSRWEQEALTKCPIKPTLYLRYLDDIFGIWSHSLTQFTEFFNILNNHHPSIKLKHTIDAHEINFLDTTVFFQVTNSTQYTLQTKVYFKHTDTHSLLHKTSYHPRHTFKGLIKSQIIRFHRICSNPLDFHSATTTLFKSLRTRGYSKRFLRSIKSSTLASLAPTRSQTTPLPAQAPESDPPDSSLSSHPPCHTPQLVPFVSTFSHKITGLHHIIKQNFTNSKAHHPAFNNLQIISAYRKHKSLKSLLVTSLYSEHKNTPQPQLTHHFKSRKIIHNIRTGSSYPILASLPLATRNVVYIITCTLCNKHYIGETQHSIQTRLNQHLYNIRAGRLTTHLVSHFTIHPLTHLIISGLEHNDRWTCGQRKRAERIWIQRLGTMAPGGLNED